MIFILPEAILYTWKIIELQYFIHYRWAIFTMYSKDEFTMNSNLYISLETFQLMYNETFIVSFDSFLSN